MHSYYDKDFINTMHSYYDQDFINTIKDTFYLNYNKMSKMKHKFYFTREIPVTCILYSEVPLQF